MRRESSGLVYNFVVVWVVWINFCFHVWLFAITVISSLWHYLFVGIAPLTRPKTWPVGIDHCSVCYCFHGSLSKYAANLRHYLDTNLRAEKCVPAINIGLNTSIMISTLLLEGRHIKCVPVSVTLLRRIIHLCRLPMHAES